MVYIPMSETVLLGVGKSYSVHFHTEHNRVNPRSSKMHISSVLSLLLAAAVALAVPTPTEKRTSACSPVGISAQSSAQVVRKFKQFGVVPTLIPSISPKVAVKVAYGSKQVNLGNTFAIPGQWNECKAYNFDAELSRRDSNGTNLVLLR
jgi:hypothetical protein